jgi:hypothetical protein
MIWGVWTGSPINTYNEWVAATLSIIYSIVEIILGSSYLFAMGSAWTSSVSFLSDGVWILLLEAGIIGWKSEVDYGVWIKGRRWEWCWREVKMGYDKI